jgi:hypothetical protein
MQVSQVNDHVTHTVIGGGESIDFAISSSAEFFNILSSTLYKDQILAVVREVLCNANDAHIEAGCTDTPVQITLTEEKFVVKDFGKGIHRDDIGPIYGTYGNSTKKNDGSQTGGFGLGCKAPFAYTEHFEVISCHDGVKTIYNLSKSSAEANGKPGIVPIVSFPTDETGLQVSIKIKNRTDYHRFLTLVIRIVSNGDMNMTLNGEKIPCLGFDASKTNYMVTADLSILDIHSRIMIRYGNVIYPVDFVKELVYYKHIVSFLNSLSHAYNIIFQAPPHSIAVTPSRESLSMQDHTIKTLNKLFADFLELKSAKFDVNCEAYAEESVKQAIKDRDIAELLKRKEELPITKEFQIASINNLFDMRSMAYRYMQKNYPQIPGFRKADITRRLTGLADAGLVKRGLVQTFIKTINRVKYKGKDSNDWLQRRIIKPIVTKMITTGLDQTRFYTFDHEVENAPYSWSNKPAIVLATKARPNHLFSTIPYFRNIVVVSASLKDLWDRIKKHETFVELGQFDGFLFYHATMKKNEKEAAIKFFTDLGMRVVDLTVRQDYEQEPTKVAAPVRKPPKKGLVALNSVIVDSLAKDKRINTKLALKEDAPRIDNPEFVVKVSYNNDIDSRVLPNWDKETSYIILKLFGDKGAITNNSATETKWVNEKGVKMFKEYIDDKLISYISNSATIKEFWSFKSDRLHGKLEGYQSDLLDAVYANPLSRTEFGIKNNLTDEDKLYLALWEFKVQNNWRLPPNLQKLSDELNNIPLDPVNDDVVAKFNGNKLLSMIDAGGFNKFMRNADPTSPITTKAIEILVAVLNQ